MAKKPSPSNQKRVPLSERKLSTKIFNQADLEDIQLTECRAKHSLDASSKPPFKVEIVIEAHSNLTTADKMLVARIRIQVIARPASNPDQSLDVECTYNANYRLGSVEGITEPAVHAFTRFIAVNNVWPFAREFIHQMTARLGVPPFRLPLYKPESEQFAGALQRDQTPTHGE